MSAQIKQRIVGITVLLFLALIIVPWLFGKDRAVHIEAKKSVNQNLAPAQLPESTENDSLQQLPRASNQEKEKQNISNPPATDSDEEPEATETDYKPPKINPGPMNHKVVESHYPTEARPVSPNKINQIEETVMHTAMTPPPPKGVPQNKPVTASNTPKTNSEKVKLPEIKKSVTLKRDEKTWTIQLGSFTNKDNAQNLVKALKAKGYPAYSKLAKNVQGEVITKVFVGPEPEHVSFPSIVSKIEKSFNVHGVRVKSNL